MSDMPTKILAWEYDGFKSAWNVDPEESPPHAVGYRRADLPPTRDQVAAMVKPLKWCGDFAEYAETPWGRYVITDRVDMLDPDRDFFGWSFTSRGDCDESDDIHLTQDAAKVAAQSDYTARILSALNLGDQ